MEVHFTPELERKLNELASQRGQGADELVQDLIAASVDEVAEVRAMLDNRYDDLKSGRVKPISGEDIEAYFRDKSATARRQQPGS